MFNGRLALDLIHPHPEADPEEEERARPFLEALHTFAAHHIDGDAIDRDGWVPEEVLHGLAELGAAGPTGTSYGHPPGTCVIAVDGPVSMSEEIRTGSAQREDNMWEFSRRALDLLTRALQAASRV